jgi:photosystem II stability/assembly factor-like uncharacterized protein
MRNVFPLVGLMFVIPWSGWSGAHEGVPPDGATARRVVEARLDGKVERTHPQTGPDRAAAFLRRQRIPLDGDEVPMQAFYERFQEIKAREAARRGSLPGGIQNWRAIGPGNIGGRTRAIAIDPVNPDKMFAAGVSGGIWRSFDGGSSWTPVDDMMLNLAVCTIVIDPTNPDVIYAGTGEGYGNQIFVPGLGIFKSTDGGQTFDQLPSTSPLVTGAFTYVNKLSISPNDPTRLYAATRYGMYRSLDGGGSWDVVLGNPFYVSAPFMSNGCTLGCLDVAVRTDSDPDVIFAAFGSQQADGLFRSDDGGDTWVGYTTPSYQGRMTIAIAPTDNDRIYLGMADNGGLSGWGRIAGLFRSDDGITFAYAQDPEHKFTPWLFSYASIATGCLTGYPIYSQGWYDQAIAVDPADPDKLFLGGIDQYRSDDAGYTFGMTGYLFFREEEPSYPHYIHVDQHTIVFHPDYDGVTNQTMFVGNDGGLWKTENARAASTQEECPIAASPGPPPEVVWESLNNGYAVTQFYHGAVAKTADVFIAGAQDNGTSRVGSTTTPNDWAEIYGGDGGYVAIDHTDDDVVYVEIQGFPTMVKSIDGGETFVDATGGITDTDGLFITPFAMDPSDPLVLWTGGSRPWRTTNGAASWTPAGPDIPAGSQISAVAIAPGDGNVVYLGFSNGYVARTTDGLAGSPTWSLISAGLPVGGWVSSVAVDPVNPEVAYTTYSTAGVQHIFRTADGGGSWTSIDGVSATGIPDIPVHWIAVRPDNSAQLYAGTEFGVFATDDTGTTWAPANTGLANTVVESLEFQDPNTLVAFTFGRGVFVATLDAVVDVPESGDPGAVPRIALGASPARGRATIHLDVPAAGSVSVTIHDVMGRLVSTLHDGVLDAGRTSMFWDGRTPAGSRAGAGTYFVRFNQDGHVRTRKFVFLP